ncbi:hypothetical protein [Roseovarius arcticus]|nr:hypothetical protein [Roseovarius arcticus]
MRPVEIHLSAEAAPWTYDDTNAVRLRACLTTILTKLATLAPTLKGTS